MPVEYIKIIGERNSGTNYIEKIINENFHAAFLPGSIPRLLNKTLGCEFVRDYYFKKTQHKNLGWKHAVAPTNNFLESVGMKDSVGFVAIAKNPYAWLLSMFRRPYHLHTEQQTFDQFIRRECKTVLRERHADPYKSPMDMWNKKNRSYAELCNYAQGLTIPYESILSAPDVWLQLIQDRFSLVKKAACSVNINEDVKGGKNNLAFYKDYYLNRRWLEKLTLDQISRINQSLDESVMQAFGYKKINCNE
ncbi:MAG: hypothetical protein ACJA05_002595 [Porticoccus sp.]|jgi:hypothetical protein|uniref:hypothetical protein n=1 Tax=Porticoccus sp. TaxID=2024853 RepID=UPI0039E470D7